MKKALKIVGWLLVTVVIIIVALLTFVKTALPNVGEAEELTIEYTPERIERGRYLANAVTVCMDCHSTRNWSKFSAPPVDGTLGKGGERFDQSVGMPGVYYSRNITPEGIARYTDGELFRAITAGVSKEGTALFPLMPYPYYGRMDKKDIYAIIAYIRTLKPIANEVPESTHDFPMNFIVNTIPAKGEAQSRPDTSDVLAYGAYLTNAASCKECHTQVKNGQIVPESAFSGGREFLFPDGAVVRSANITPDEKTGIGKWTEAAFVERFKAYADSGFVAADLKPGEFNTIMPWTMYAQMTPKDLAAIYTYLKTIQPIDNSVTKFSPAVSH